MNFQKPEREKTAERGDSRAQRRRAHVLFASLASRFCDFRKNASLCFAKNIKEAKDGTCRSYFQVLGQPHRFWSWRAQRANSSCDWKNFKMGRIRCRSIKSLGNRLWKNILFIFKNLLKDPPTIRQNDDFLMFFMLFSQFWAKIQQNKKIARKAFFTKRSGSFL